MYRVSLQEIRSIYTAGRVVEKVTRVRGGISNSGENFRKDMAVKALEMLPNPSAIEKYATSLEEYGLGEEARRLRQGYEHIQRFSRGDLRTSKK